MDILNTVSGLLPPEVLTALTGLDLSKPESIKTLVVTALVVALLALGKLTIRLAIAALKLLAKKTKTPLDDEAIEDAEKQIDKK